jgi:hypothetical protein
MSRTVSETIRRLGGGLEGEPRLSRSPRPGERDEPRIVATEELDHLPKLAVATEEGCCGNRKIHPIEALEGRELADAELEDALRCREILEAMLPQIA